MLWPATVSTAPALIIFIDRIVDGNDGGVELGPISGIPMEYQHVDVLRGQGFTDEKCIRGPIAHVAKGNFGAGTGKHSPDVTGIVGRAVIGARCPSPLRHVAKLLVRFEVTEVVQTLRSHAPHVVAGWILRIKAIARATSIGEERG